MDVRSYPMPCVMIALLVSIRQDVLQLIRRLAGAARPLMHMSRLLEHDAPAPPLDISLTRTSTREPPATSQPLLDEGRSRSDADRQSDAE